MVLRESIDGQARPADAFVDGMDLARNLSWNSDHRLFA